MSKLRSRVNEISYSNGICVGDRINMGMDIGDLVIVCSGVGIGVEG